MYFCDIHFRIKSRCFNSGETNPELNASAAFKTVSDKLFMSDYDMGDGGHVFRTC